MKNNAFYLFVLFTLFISGCSQKISDQLEYSTTSTEAARQMDLGFRYQDNVARHLARRSFQKAVDLDPEYALGYFCLAQMTDDAVKRYALVEKGNNIFPKQIKGKKQL